jgi:hypothetical protein
METLPDPISRFFVEVEFNASEPGEMVSVSLNYNQNEWLRPAERVAPHICRAFLLGYVAEMKAETSFNWR